MLVAKRLSAPKRTNLHEKYDHPYFRELRPKQRSMLEAASVCGRQFRVSTLADVLGEGVPLLAAACAEFARGQRWLREVPAGPTGASSDGGYVFRHALYREVVYERLDRRARGELHRRLKASVDPERPERRSAASIIGLRDRVSSSGCVGLARRRALPMPA